MSEALKEYWEPFFDLLYNEDRLKIMLVLEAARHVNFEREACKTCLDETCNRKGE